MKNLMNNVDNVLTESLDGFAAAHADIVALGAEHEYVRRKRNKPGKVALISGGGSALLSLPAPGLDFADKQAINSALLKSGAAIDEMNARRERRRAGRTRRRKRPE